MQLEVSLIQFVTVCSVINGLVFAFLLFEKKENRIANRFLSLTILSMCLTFTPFVFNVSVWNAYQWLAWLPFSLSYWIGPAFYLYVRILTQSKASFQRKDLLHFSPIVLNYLHSIYHGVVVNTDPWPWFHHLAEWLEVAAIISILIYMVLSFRVVKNYQRSLLDNVSNTDEIDLKWVNQIILAITFSCFLIVAFLIASFLAGGKYSLQNWDDPRAFALLFYSAILYWLSISGYRQAQTQPLFILDTLETTDTAEFSNIIQKLMDTLNKEKLYRNSELSLTDLSKATGVTERTISNSINQELGKNFFQFINEYRLQEIKEQLLDPANDHLKIMSLALDAGFNSKSSFNRVFKQYTGQTPKDFKSSNR